MHGLVHRQLRSGRVDRGKHHLRPQPTQLGHLIRQTDRLAAENTSVADDAARFAGQQVDGPLTAYYEADIIATYSMALSAGKTHTPLPLSRHEPASCTEDTHSDPSASSPCSDGGVGRGAYARQESMSTVRPSVEAHREP